MNTRPHRSVRKSVSLSAKVRLVEPSCLFLLLILVLGGAIPMARGEAMLQLFNVSWNELSRKMPEIAEAGYTSLWLPPPSKAGSVYSVGYDQFDPFDLGDKNQRGTVPTKYGTKAELLQMVEIAHRFGIRVYFDNIMNHRGFDIPGYNSTTPTNLYPGMVPGDFHLKTVSGGYFANWPNISNWGNVWEVQNQPLFGLIDIANEPGSVNANFGGSLGSTISKPYFIRHPGIKSYYPDTTRPSIGGGWYPFNGTNGVPVAEDVNAYLIRSAMWLMNETKCDGFRFDAVKHVPSVFFGDTTDNPFGYTGAIQTMYDYVHGYGNNVTGNGYVEGDDNRNSLFDSEVPRNDALLFGEHLGEPPSYGEYIDRGMRLLNSPFQYQLNQLLGNPSASLVGLDQRDYRPYGSAFTGPQSILFAQSHDNATSYHRELQNAYNFIREGLPDIYTDGYNQSGPPDYFPKIAYAPYLGEFGDNKMPDVAYLHHQLARGGTRARWADNDIVAFERYDWRDVSGNGFTNANATVVLFAMNDNSVSDISFDDGVTQTTDGTYYECFPVSGSRGQGIVVGFPPGSVLAQLADSPNKNSACSKLLVRYATQNINDAIATANDPNPMNRKVYVGSQALAPGGGAIEIKVPANSYVCYAYQWPEPSRVSGKDAITFRQNGTDAPRMTVYRQDGVNGDSGFNPYYPFKMRGSVDASGYVVTGSNVATRTYAIDVPVLTNAPFDMVFRCDASAVNIVARMDGGLDLNSQMGLGPANGFDRRDNRPGYTTDVFMGYEQALWQFRYGPEKFGSADISRNNVTSLGAETYHYIVGATNFVVNGAGNGVSVRTQTATWVKHDPGAANTAAGTNATPTQRIPFDPVPNQDVYIWVKSANQFEVDKCFIYYTTNGSNPEGSFGTGRGTTQVAEATWRAADSTVGTNDWWRGTIPGVPSGREVSYKVALYKGGYGSIGTISDADSAKSSGLTQFGITNFNPTTVTAWLHNDLNTNNTATGLKEGFHIVRARAFLPRDGKSGVFNTFLQTFYYDAQPPGGAIAYPAADGASISNSTYSVVVRADSSVTGVDFNISDSNAANDDVQTGQVNGNGLGTNGLPIFVSATAVTPNPAISQQYPDYPLEFRFNYAAVPNSGTAALTVRLRKFTAAVVTNRMTTLTRNVNTYAPSQVVSVSSPATDGTVLTNVSAGNPFTFVTCFSTNLSSSRDFFSIYINGVFQPRLAGDGTPLYIISPFGCGTGMRSLSYAWPGQPGTNLFQVVYNNQVVLSDSRIFVVANPFDDSDSDGLSDYAETMITGTDPFSVASTLRMTGVTGGDNPAVYWQSVASKNYQVLATTNLVYPMAPIGPVIPATGPSAYYIDSDPDRTNKFYRVKVVP